MMSTFETGPVATTRSRGPSPKTWDATQPLRLRTYRVSGSNTPLQQMRGPRGYVPIQPRERDRAQHPARPEDPEAERSQATQQPPRQRRDEHAEVGRLLRHRHAV